MNIRADTSGPVETTTVDDAFKPIEASRQSRRRVLSLRRLFFGGRIDDRRRLPRYLALVLFGAAAIWAPIGVYLETAPLRFTSTATLILPGAGAANSVNLSDIGQATSSAASPYSSSALSPTVTYKKLLSSTRVVDAAAARAEEAPKEFGAPRVRLVDQTGLVFIEMTGRSPEHARARATALTETFFAELADLRRDEVTRREQSARAAIDEYKSSVSAIRAEISALQSTSGLKSLKQYGALIRDRETVAAQLAQIEARRNRLTGEEAALSRLLDASPSQAAMSMKLHADPEFTALAEALGHAASALAKARGADLGERHPTLLAARDAYSGAASRLKQRGTTLLAPKTDALTTALDLSTSGERPALLAALVRLHVEAIGVSREHDAVSQALASIDRRLSTLGVAAAALDDLERDYQVAEAVFASALARVDTSKADLFASYPLVQVLEPASLPDSPSSPKVILAIAAGVAASLLLSVAMLLAWLRQPLLNWLLQRATTS